MVGMPPVRPRSITKTLVHGISQVCCCCKVAYMSTSLQICVRYQPYSCMLPKDQSQSLVTNADCTWQKQLMAMVRTDRPSTLFLFFQNPMSFLKAKKSNTECSSETAHVSARKIGLPSSRTRLNSSDSPSPIAPQDCCSRKASQRRSSRPAANRLCMYSLVVSGSC